MSWKSKLLKPVIPARGKPIVTLSDARAFILRLPKERQKEEIVQAAIEAVLSAAEGRGPLLIAQSAMALIVHGPIKPLGGETRDRPWLKR